MQCLLELFFKNSDIDANNFLLSRLLASLKNSISYSNVVEGLDLKYWLTPERIVINIAVNDVIKYSKKGVKLQDKKEYLEYFLKKNNLSDVDVLSIKDDTYYYNYNVSGSDFCSDLIKNINTILSSAFSRNYKNILILLKNIYFNVNDECKNIIFNNIKSSDSIIIGKEEFKIESNENYFKILKENNIYLDHKERKDFVNNNLNILNDDFINNVLFIKEKPLFLFGKIKFNCNSLFLKILEEFTKNKYVFFTKDDFLYFIFLSDNGFERIDDFDKDHYDKDILINKNKIEKIIYKINNKINSYGRNKKSKEYKFIFNDSRLNRILKITNFLSLWVHNSDLELISLILSSPVYKNSNFLENNTELDLLLKKYFLLQNNKNEEFVNSIIDSLKPAKNSDDLPTIPSSVAISISNKLDTIIYYNILNELKRSIDKNMEKDVYNNLLRVIIKNNIDLPLKIMIDYSLKNFINETISKKQDRLLIKKYKINKNTIVSDILEKIYNKLYHYLVNFENCNENIANLAISAEIDDISNIKNKCHILKLYNKVKNMSLYCKEFDYLVMSYKRVNNLLVNKKILKNTVILQPRKFISKYEKTLYDDYFKLKKDIKIHNNDYEKVLNSLLSLSNSLNDFLNNVYINKVNIFKRKKYIKLLFSIKVLYNEIIKFDNIL